MTMLSDRRLTNIKMFVKGENKIFGKYHQNYLNISNQTQAIQKKPFFDTINFRLTFGWFIEVVGNVLHPICVLKPPV